MTAFDAGAFHPSEVRRVPVGDITMGYREIGSGPPLLMIQGLTGTMAEWDPALVNGLAQGHRVLVFDNRGMATSSDVPGNDMSIEQMADDTAGLLEALAIDRAHVLGWSTGGEVAQLLAIRHPARVDRLVLCATDPGSPHAVKSSDPAATAFLASPGGVDDVMPLIFPPGHESDAQSYMERIFAWPGLGDEDFTTAPGEVALQVRADERWTGPGGGAYDRLGEISASTLVAHGEADMLEPPENARLIAERIPNATLELYPDAGHAFLFQLADQFSADVRAFLSD